MEDMKSGKIEGSVLSQSLDYVTAEDGESDLIWKLLRADLEVAGVSTSLIDKHRVLITAKFKELLDSGELTGVHDERNENPLNDQGIKLIEEAEISESETESDLSDREVFFGFPSRGHIAVVTLLLADGAIASTQDADSDETRTRKRPSCCPAGYCQPQPQLTSA